MKGGAKLDDEYEASIYISDSDDVYGIVNIQRGSEIVFDQEADTRFGHIRVVIGLFL